MSKHGRIRLLNLSPILAVLYFSYTPRDWSLGLHMQFFGSLSLGIGVGPLNATLEVA